MKSTPAVAIERDVVLLDFWAEWCGACRLIAPVLDRIAGADPRLLLEKVNVAEAAEMAAAMNVTSLPTLIVQDMTGRELMRLTGPLSGQKIEAALAVARQAL